MKAIIQEKLSIKSRIALLVNILIEECPVPFYIWLLLITYETILYIAMPLSIPTKFNAQYGAFKNVILKIAYVRAILLTSFGGSCILTIVHAIITLSVPTISIFLISFCDLRIKRKSIQFMGKVCAACLILQYALMLLPMSRNFWGVAFGLYAFKFGMGYRILSGFAYVSTLFCASVSPMIFSVNPNSKVPWAGTFTMLHYFRSILKVSLSIYMAVDAKLKYSWVATIILIVPLVCYLIKSILTDMLYKKALYFMYTFQMTLFLLCIIIFQIEKVANSEVVIEDFVSIVVMSIIISILMLVYQSKQNSNVSKKAIDKIESQSDAEKYAISVFRLIKSKSNSLQIVSILCNNSEWLSMPKDTFNEAFHYFTKRNHITEEHNKENAFSFFDIIFKKLCNKFERSELLKLIYSLYSWEINKNLYKSYFIAISSLSSSINIHHLILASKQLNDLYHYFENEKQPIFTQIHHSAEFNLNVLALNSECRKVAHNMMALFKILSQNEISMKLMQTQIIKISKHLSKLEADYSKIIQIASFHMESYYRICCFYWLVLSSDKYISKYIDIIEKHKSYFTLSSDSNKIFDFNHEIMVVIISGDESNLETILYVSNDSTNILNYLPKELVKQPITLIMPSILRDAHRGFLLSFQETGKTSIINQKITILAYSKQCFLVPVDTYITSLLYITKSTRYIGYFKKQIASEIYKTLNFPNNYQSEKPLLWLLSLDGDIIGMNEYSYDLLGIPSQYLEIKKGNMHLNVNQLIPAIGTMLEQKDSFGQGFVATLSLEKLYSCLDFDLLEELKINVSNNKDKVYNVFAKLHKETHHSISYYTLIFSLITEKTKLLNRHQTEDLSTFMNNASQSSVSLSLPGDNTQQKLKMKKTREVKALLFISFIILAAPILLSLYSFMKSISQFEQIEENMDSYILQSRTSIFLLNIVTLSGRYIKTHDSAMAVSNLSYINSLMQEFTTYIRENGESISRFSTNVSDFELHQDGNSTVGINSMYAMLLIILEKLSYLLNMCNESEIWDLPLYFISPTMINLSLPISICTQYLYEILINTYSNLYLSCEESVIESFTKINSTMKSQLKLYYINVETIIVCVICVGAVILVMSFILKAQKALMYQNILYIPKQLLTSRMLLIKQYTNIAESNQSLKLQTRDLLSMDGPIDKPEELTSSMYSKGRQKASVPISTLTVITLYWLGSMIGVIFILIVLLRNTLSKFEHYQSISEGFVQMKMYSSDASFLFYLSCTYDKEIYPSASHDIISLLAKIYQEYTNLQIKNSGMFTQPELNENICKVITTANASFYNKLISYEKCKSSYYGMFNHRTDEIIELYILTIKDYYYTLLEEGECDIATSQTNELYDLMDLYLNPIILTELSHMSSDIRIMEASFHQINNAFYIINILMIVIAIFLLIFSFRQTMNEKYSIEIIEQYIKPPKYNI